MNSFIHTLMYYYYMVTVLGISPSWKKYLTTMQIIQVGRGGGEVPVQRGGAGLFFRPANSRGEGGLDPPPP